MEKTTADNVQSCNPPAACEAQSSSHVSCPLTIGKCCVVHQVFYFLSPTVPVCISTSPISTSPPLNFFSKYTECQAIANVEPKQRNQGSHVTDRDCFFTHGGPGSFKTPGHVPWEVASVADLVHLLPTRPFHQRPRGLEGRRQLHPHRELLMAPEGAALAVPATSC